MTQRALMINIRLLSQSHYCFIPFVQLWQSQWHFEKEFSKKRRESFSKQGNNVWKMQSRRREYNKAQQICSHRQMVQHLKINCGATESAELDLCHVSWVTASVILSDLLHLTYIQHSICSFLIVLYDFFFKKTMHLSSCWTGWLLKCISKCFYHICHICQIKKQESWLLVQ